MKAWLHLAAAWVCLSAALQACLVAWTLTGLALAQQRALEPTAEAVAPDVAAPASVKDYLITAGGLLEGTLLGCAGESCTIAGTSILIAQTFFIGLGVEAPAPPQLPDYMHDQVVLQDGTVQQGRMIGISDESVVTDRGSFARADVAWLYLFPQADETAQPDSFGAPEDNPRRAAADRRAGGSGRRRGGRRSPAATCHGAARRARRVVDRHD